MDISFLDFDTIFFLTYTFASCIQLFYYLFFFSRLAFYTDKGQPIDSRPVSVVICARDEARNLETYLTSVLEQDFGDSKEFVVVNHNSQDSTMYVLGRFKEQYPELEVIDLRQEAKLIRGKKFPLSMGIKSAKNGIVLLTDADCWPVSKHWIEKMQQSYRKGIDIVLGYGGYKKEKGLLNLVIRYETLHTALQYLSYALAGLPYMGVGRNLSYKKDVFLKNKGFSSINMVASGDDDLFINQVANAKNTAINIGHDTHTLSEPKKTWEDWMRQKYRHYTTNKYYKPIHKFLLGMYALSLFCIFPFWLVSIFTRFWIFAMALFSIRFIIQGITFFQVSRKLNEKGLWPYFPLFDFWMFIYYVIMTPSLFGKGRKTWD